MKNKVLVLVTNQYSCERLIRAGRKIADEHKLELSVLSVQPKSFALKQSEQLDFLYSIAIENHAEMTVHFEDNAVIDIKKHIKNIHASHIIVGRPPQNKQSEFLKTLIKQAKDVVVYLVDDNGKYITLSHVVA